MGTDTFSRGARVMIWRWGSQVRTYFCQGCFLIDETLLHRIQEACSANSFAKMAFRVAFDIFDMMEFGVKIRGRGTILPISP